MEYLAAKSREASQLRQRRSELSRRYGIPQELVGSSLTVSRRRCGKSSCHCSRGPGHPQWALGLSVAGSRRVEKVPRVWVEELERAVLETEQFLDAVKEVMAINLELVGLSKRGLNGNGSKADVRGLKKSSKSRSTFSSHARSYFHVSQSKF